MHIQKKWNSGVLFSLLFTLLLTACSSGGGDSAPPAGTAEGQWTGTITNPLNSEVRAIAGVVLGDGTYWFWYSAVVDPLQVAGVLQGGSSSQNGTFASSNEKNFSNELGEINFVPVTASYVMKNSLNGKVKFTSDPAEDFPLTSTFDTEYNFPPLNIASVAGTYTGSVSQNSNINPTGVYEYTIDVSVSNVITVVATQGPPIANTSGIELGCDYTGTLTARTHGNVYNITDFTTSNADPRCNLVDSTGVVFFDTDPVDPTKIKIYILTQNSTRTLAFPFTGTKQ